MTHPLDGARKRIERANDHLNNLVSILETYATEHQNSFVVEHDHARNQPNVIMPVPKPFPWEIPFIVSDCVHNLRAALDYLMFELAREDSGDPHPEYTEFLICPLKKFNEHRVARDNNKGPLRYLSPSHVHRIEAYQPYMGVTWTETLRTLSNQDKHRQLIIMRGQRITNITDGIGETFKGVGPDRIDVQMERKTTVPITFEDGTPVIETLEIMKREVALIIDSFSPEFKV
jgi:hypothetical protein